MTDPVTISVVIPAYNAEKTIVRTLESVFAQTLQPLEILVVDDGSKDSTPEIISRYAPRVRLIRQKNAGPSAARNHGVREAQGAWIALLDSDDAWLPGKLERQTQALAPDVALVHCNAVGYAADMADELTFDMLWEHNCIGTSTVVLNRALFLQLNGFHESRALIGAEDYNMWLRMAATGKRVVTVHDELSLYTPAPNSLSQQLERVVEGELLNVQLIAEEFQLPENQVLSKQSQIFEEYAKSLFWIRDLPRARRYYGELLKRKRTPSAALHWLATFLPAGVLNLRRQATPAAPTTPAAAPELVCSK